MIYGLNFNGSHIPGHLKAIFRSEVRVGEKSIGKTKRKVYVYATLQGVAQTKDECDSMQIVASNGKRKIHIETRNIGLDTWYGVYIY